MPAGEISQGGKDQQESVFGDRVADQVPPVGYTTTLSHESTRHDPFDRAGSVADVPQGKGVVREEGWRKGRGGPAGDEDGGTDLLEKAGPVIVK